MTDSFHFRTRNAVYRVELVEDGLTVIQGHARYCPLPVKVKLAQSIEVGRRVVWTYYGPRPFLGIKDIVITTPVLEMWVNK